MLTKLKITLYDAVGNKIMVAKEALAAAILNGISSSMSRNGVTRINNRIDLKTEEVELSLPSGTLFVGASWNVATNIPLPENMAERFAYEPSPRLLSELRAHAARRLGGGWVARGG